MSKVYSEEYIQRMKPSDIDRDFIDYYLRLTPIKKKDFKRNHLFLGLAIEMQNKESDTDNKIKLDSVTPEDNVYNGMNIDKIIDDNSIPLVLMTIDDNRLKCPVHRTGLIRYNPKFRDGIGQVSGIYIYYCKDCGRFYIWNKMAREDENRLAAAKRPYCIFDYEVTKNYINSHIKPFAVGRDDTIYFPKYLIRENPLCPCHDKEMDTVPCICQYKDVKYEFNGFYCEDCKKIMMHRVDALDVLDNLAGIGIPSFQTEEIQRSSPKKEPVTRNVIVPDYYIEDGTRKEFKFEKFNSFYELQEADTVVVSDSIYCELEEHRTEEVLGLIWVKEKTHGRKSYLFKLGYCSECDKYYIEKVDFERAVHYGRLEVNTQMNIENDEEMISSGEVYISEKNHLSQLEETIQEKIDALKMQPDYVSQYETFSYYDEGNLSLQKSTSRHKYEGELQRLHNFQEKPYKYRVDIQGQKNSETYYVGKTAIEIDGKKHVIVEASKLGRELVNYRTKSIKKDDGDECAVKLNREFDISDAYLYGYRNLKTDEDLIFRKGITDPYLARNLRIRKRQHNLIDIYVTIQENQNRIVDCELENNVIVQGCAGSGKTMVLLHRLASLKEKNPDLNFEKHAVILTPSDNFTLHISGLADELQIGFIKRMSVEKYYNELIKQYSSDFALKDKEETVTEKNASGLLADYIYSDDFKRVFFDNYARIMDERNAFAKQLQTLAEQMGEEPFTFDEKQGDDISDALSKKFNELYKKVESIETRINRYPKLLKEFDDAAYDISRKIFDQNEEIDEVSNTVITMCKANIAKIISEINENNDNESQKLQRVLGKITDITLIKENYNNLTETLSLDEVLQNFNDYVDDDIKINYERLNEEKDKFIALNKEQDNFKEIVNIPISDLLNGRENSNRDISSLQSRKKETLNNIELLNSEYNRIKNATIVFGRSARLAAIDKKIAEQKNEIGKIDVAVCDLYEEIRRTVANNEKEIKKQKNVIQKDELSIKNKIPEKIEEKISLLEKTTNDSYALIDCNNKALDAYNRIINGVNTDSDQATKTKWIEDITQQNILPKEEKDNWIKAVKILEGLLKDQENNNIKKENSRLRYEELLSERYSPDVVNAFETMNGKINNYLPFGLYETVFDSSIVAYIKENRIKYIKGKTHRFDLYARLLFLHEYFGKKIDSAHFICVDEGQDLSFNEYRLIGEINKNKPILNIFGDINQLIKPKRGISDWDNLRKEINADFFTLNENYRNTNQITRFCNNTFDMQVLETGVDGASVKEITRYEFTNSLSELEVGDKRIAIILPGNIKKKEYLKQLDLDEMLLKKISLDNIGNGIISLLNVNESKGIEFEIAFVVANKMERNEKYIAFTRALERLFVVDERIVRDSQDEDNDDER